VKLAPSTADLTLREKASEAVALLRDYADRRRMAPEAPAALAEVDEYALLLERHGGRPLADARVLEIGYGARPWRLIAMRSMGVNATGVDAEVPILTGRPREYIDVYRRNGIERAAKSLLRRTLFDRRERRAFHDELRRRGLAERVDPEAFLVSDAADLDLPDDSLDLIVSEDVFEHVATGSLGRLVPAMARWLRPGGLALIRPNVFTGITGGHLVEWYRSSFERPGLVRRSEPWEHLRRRRFIANTHLNELTRSDYRSLFSTAFEILEERVRLPDLGREHLTPEVAADLSDWSEEELFSNQVLFVLRPQ
jgi:SAM-dependent methyltransferase